MKKIFSIHFILLLVQISFAQTANFSLPEKNNKNYDYAVLGKTTEGIMLYKFNKIENIIQCYDAAMNLKWFKDAQMDNKSTLEHISVHNNKLLVFFSFHRNKSTLMAAQKFSAKMEPEGNYTLVDSIADENFSGEWYVKHSEDKMFYMAYYVKNSKENETTLQTILLNDNLKIERKKAVIISESKSEMYDELMDNNGNFYFFVCNQERVEGSPKVISANPRFYSLKKNENISGAHYFTVSTKKFNSLIPKIDNISNSFYLVGIAKEKKSDSQIPGFQVSKWLLEKDSLAVDQLETYTTDIQKEMKLLPETDINNFEITDVILKFDGGMILVAENTYSTTQTVEIPNYYSPSFPTIRTYTYIHKDDLFLQSFDNNGEAEWHQIIRKKQTSENDGGYYSSYGLLKGKNSIQILFNEAIEEQSNLTAYSIKPNGIVKRNSIYGSRQKNVFLAPHRASQVSLYEEIIPSQNRGYFQMMKIDF